MRDERATEGVTVVGSCVENTGIDCGWVIICYVEREGEREEEEEGMGNEWECVEVSVESKEKRRERQ